MMNRTFATLKNLNLIDSNSIFRHLTDEELAQIPIDQEPEFYKRGTIIYEEGSRIPGFFCVQKGIIKIYKTGFDGKERACTTAKVIEDAAIIQVTADMVIHLVKTNGEFAYDLLRIACNELGEANDYITDIAQKTVRERLAEVLIHLR